MSDGLCLLLLPFLAFAVRFDFELSGSNMRLYLDSFPVVLTATYISFFFIGLYRGIWRHTGLEDLGRLAKGVIGGTLLAVGALLFFYRFSGYSRAVFVLYPRLGYRPIGFLDDDTQKHGRMVLGLPVFGSIERLPAVRERQSIQGLIIASASILANGNGEKARALCQECDIWMRRLRLEFVED